EQRRLTKEFPGHHRCKVTRLAVLCTRNTNHAVGNEVHVVAWLPLPENDLALGYNLQVHPDRNSGELFEWDVLKARHPLHEGNRLQLELGDIMTLQAVQLMREVLFQTCCYWCGQRAVFGLLRDGFRLCDKKQSRREPFLHIVDQVWKLLGDLIQGVLYRLVRTLILVPYRVDNVAGRGFDTSQRIEHVEHASTALQARPCYLVVQHD